MTEQQTCSWRCRRATPLGGGRVNGWVDGVCGPHVVPDWCFTLFGAIIICIHKEWHWALLFPTLLLCLCVACLWAWLFFRAVHLPRELSMVCVKYVMICGILLDCALISAAG
ncbi:hypothetical protein TcCL_Unassigned02035 [Trypanosoma cruzi]|nr:hypothetical protein TcCL_Unassigned02035 [Trypanosoma cruzi]